MKPAPTIPTRIGPGPLQPLELTVEDEHGTFTPDGGYDELYAFAHEIGPAAVFVGDHRRLGRPADAERRIVPAHAALGQAYEYSDTR